MGRDARSERPSFSVAWYAQQVAAAAAFARGRRGRRRYVQERFGHATIETTPLYTKVSIQKLREVHAATHPGAKLVSRADPTNSGGEAGEARALATEELLCARPAEAVEEDTC